MSRSSLARGRAPFDTRGGGSLPTRRALANLRRQLLRREQQLRAHEQKLADQHRYMATVAHDLRSPLQTVNVALALISAEAAPSMEKPLRLAKASLLRASGLLYDLLDLSALTQGERILLKKQKQKLSELLTHAVDDARLRFPDRHFDVSVPAHEIWVDVDPRRIAQVLDNLISNALFHGLSHTSIVLRIESHPEEVTVHVRNAGVIAEAARATLFQPLSQGEGAFRRGSMGLGLYIVKQLVDAHGGRVEPSCDGESTTFSVVLPRLPES